LPGLIANTATSTTTSFTELNRAKPKDTLGTRVRLQLIPVKRGWETVDKWYGQALTLMLDQWQESKRKWGGDCE